MSTEKLRFRDAFMALYIVAIIALLVLPMLKYSVRYVPIIMFTVPFVAVYTMQKRKSAIVFLCFVLMLVLLFIFSFLINAPLNVNAALNLSIILYLSFFPFFIFDYLSNSDNIWETRLVLIGTTVLFLVVIISTAKAFVVDPVIARTLAKGDNEDEYLTAMRMKNVGGFSFSYAIGPLIPYFAIRIIRSKGKEKAWYISIFIALFVYVLFCQYTTLIVFAVVTSTIVFIIGSKNAVSRALLVFASLVLLLNMMRIVKFLGNNLPLESLAFHFKEIYISLSTGEETTSRLLAAKRCISLFRIHPFFGVNYSDAYYSYVIGHSHSSYFGLLASNGIVGLTLVLGTIILFIKSVYQKINDKYFMVIFISYILLGFLNPTHNAFEVSITYFMFIPLIEVYERKIKEQNYAE